MPLKTTITPESVKNMTDAELVDLDRTINAHRTSDDEADVLNAIHAEQKRRIDDADRKRLSVLIDKLAEYVMTEIPSGALTFGAGITATEVLDDDLYRAAQLLDPTPNK